MIKSPGNRILGLATVGSLLERSLRVATALLFSLVLIESAAAKTANGVDGSKASIIRLTDKSEGRTFEGIGFRWPVLSIARSPASQTAS